MTGQEEKITFKIKNSMRGCVGYYLLSYISNENRFTIQI
jgi:hypothetical protein